MKKEVLIIEDNPVNLKLASKLLAKEGYAVLAAGDAEAGITIAREQNPALILMDIQLPDMDGLTATRLLKNNPVTAHIPVIALTAFAMKGDEEKMLAAGCDDYIAKPIRYQEFLSTIDKWINKEKINE